MVSRVRIPSPAFFNKTTPFLPHQRVLKRIFQPTQGHRPMKTSFSNDDVQLHINKLPGCTVEYTVTCSPRLIEKAEKQAIKKIAKEVSIPGFRKGKVPEEVIRRNYLKALEAETKVELTQLAFQEARKLETTPIMQTEGAVQAKLIQFGEGKAEFQYFITTNPQTPSLDNLESIKVHAKPLKVIGEKEVEKEIKNLLRLFATWNDVEGRPVKEGDFVRLNGYDLSEEGEPKIFNESRLDVSKEGLSTEWLYSALLGMEIGQSKVADTTKSDEAIRLYFIIQAIIRKYQILPPANIQQDMTQIAQKHFKEASTKKVAQQSVQQAQNEQNQYLASTMMDTALMHVLDKVLHALPHPTHA
ncbi:MAG: hypothetical protein EBS28_02050 [Chlamydiae bacterium]|nr:hypothetical protein [Chlamydiota bacterium]